MLTLIVCGSPWGTQTPSLESLRPIELKRFFVLAFALGLSCCACSLSPMGDGGLDGGDAGKDGGVDAGELESGTDASCGFTVLVLEGCCGAHDIDPSGVAIAVEVAVGTTQQAGAWLPDAQLVGLGASVTGLDGAVEFYDGGSRNVYATSLSANFMGGSVFSPLANPQQPALRRAPYDSIELIGDGRGGFVNDVNDEGTAVGESLGGEARVWFRDGGIWEANGQSRLLGISNEGVAVGQRRSLINPTEFEAILVQPDGSIGVLANGTYADAIVSTKIVGGANVWLRPSLSHRTLESGGFATYGASCLSEDGQVAGGSVVTANDTRLSGGRAAVWRNERLNWIAPDALDGGLRVFSIEGCAADGRTFAALCARTNDERLPCRLSVSCP